MLSGQTAVVTGAGRNIGRGIAEALADHGVSVAVNDVEEERAQQVAGSLPSEGGQEHVALAGDATDRQTVAELAETVEDAYGGLDILVNNLGYAVNKSVFEITYDEWKTVRTLVLDTTFIWTQEFGPLLADTGGGSIVNLGSALAHRGTTNKAAYCAAKAGVSNLTRALAHDLAEYDIRVNSISPGLIGDPVGQETSNDERDTSDIPLGRIGKPADVGNVAVFLCSEYAEYVTGEDVMVTGGLR